MVETNSCLMKKIAAILYGKKVRLSDAVACYNACTGRHKEQDYSMLLKCQAWKNEKARTCKK